MKRLISGSLWVGFFLSTGWATAPTACAATPTTESTSASASAPAAATTAAESATATAATPAIDRTLGEPFTVRARPRLGAESAAVVMIEISDFGCEHCRQFEERVFPQIKKHFIDSGQVRYVVAHASLTAAKERRALFAAARCAQAQERYWALRPRLFAGAPRVATESEAFAEWAGLDARAYRICLAEPAVQAAVAADAEEVATLKLIGTPTFLLRKRDPAGGWVEMRIDGYESWEYFREALTEMVKLP